MRAASAPGKVILTGEHAVVHGGAALAVAIQRHIRAVFIPDHSSELRWKDPFSGQIQHITESVLRERSALLDARYRAWQQGELSVQAILPTPADLLIYTLSQALPQGPLSGGDLTWRSDLPVGAGMGSSAAFIAVILKLFSSAPLSHHELLRQVQFCERLQHGKGSFIDAASVSLGGTVRVQGTHIEPLQASGVNPDSYWIFTGTPLSTTGECVEQVRQQFTGSSIWQAFADIEHQWLSASVLQRAELIRQNHRLLCQLGVVPEATRRLVAQIEALGGAAKVSGAGSIRGDAAGLLLVWLPEHQPDALSLPAGAVWGALQEEPQGATDFQL